MGWLLWAGGCWGGQGHVFCGTLLAASRTTSTVFTANKGASVFSLEFKLCPFQPLPLWLSPLSLFPNLRCTFRIFALGFLRTVAKREGPLLDTRCHVCSGSGHDKLGGPCNLRSYFYILFLNSEICRLKRYMFVG